MPQQIYKANKAKRIAIDFGTTGTGIARYDESTEMACLVPVGWNVTEDSTRTRLPSAMLVTQFEDRVDMSLVLFENVSNLRAKKESEGKVVSSRIIASPKLLLDKARCKNGQLYEDASYLEKVKISPWSLYRVYMQKVLQIIKDEVDIDSIETWCLTVPVMYTKADESSEEMQDSMTREMITAARTVINKDYNINDGLEFESEPVAVMTHLAAQRSQRYENQGPILVWDAGGSTVDLAAAIVIGGAFELIIAGGASSGTYYMWEELNKCCGFDEQKFSFAKKAVEAMTEPCDITETGVSKGDVEILMKISYASAFSETLTMLTNLERRGYSAPKILVVGRAPGANQMIKDFLVSALTEKCVRVFGNSTSNYIEVLDGLDVGTSVCRGAALPYSSDPVQAFTEATVAVCYRAEGGRDLPKEFRGRDNALVVIKDSGVEQLSRQWLSCQVDGPPKGFVVHLHVIVSEREPYTYEDETGSILKCYPKTSGLTMNALPINLNGHAMKGDRIEYQIFQPDPQKPTAISIVIKCPKSRVKTQCELVKDRERIQLRLVKGCTLEEDDELQRAAHENCQGELEGGSTSEQRPQRQEKKRGRGNKGKAAPKKKKKPNKAGANP